MGSIPSNLIHTRRVQKLLGMAPEANKWEKVRSCDLPEGFSLLVSHSLIHPLVMYFDTFPSISSCCYTYRKVERNIFFYRWKLLWKEPWLVWLTGLSTDLWTKGSLVWFPLRAHAWVAAQVPYGSAPKRQPQIDISLPFFLPRFPFL